ncbi:uncharacterized protein F4822DRAFT_411228 [Hypoxylon trugodes]|uniref:uncharacterized protein n=1 Tax=Hypoxylon trugodes TaxID=326681 RepID=UPI0021996563|nr:uncharacterized protein F4822DRAFT_411228 [Hypoxylon trugodes]KAI1386787.1 hypothetical protein F4822DRAFT_411228 [Hypoxylon trugodes]
MVVRTTSLNSIKNLLPKIHQPLPISRRDSQQLLESITTSFRRNLDEEHPWEHGNEPVSQNSIPQSRKPTASTFINSNSSSPSPASTDISNRQRPTDRHLRAILSNPLFAHQNNKKSPAARRSQLDVFDHAVARGLMTPRRAAGFLAKVRSEIVGESEDDIRLGMADSGAGLRVVQWLRASGLENNLQFLSDPVLFPALIPFMYAEGLEEVAWHWMARIGTRDEADEIKDAQFAVLSSLLYAIMKQTNTSYSGLKTSLDPSYEAVIRANDILPKKNVTLKSLKDIWVDLSWASTVFASERPKPSAHLFESFVKIGRPLKMRLDLAHLELHHPLTPNHFAAVQFMHRNANSTDLRPIIRKRLLCLAMDTADRLKEVGDTEEVSWVERFLTRLGYDLNTCIGIFNALEGSLIASELPIRRM